MKNPEDGEAPPSYYDAAASSGQPAYQGYSQPPQHQNTQPLPPPQGYQGYTQPPQPLQPQYHPQPPQPMIQQQPNYQYPINPASQAPPVGYPSQAPPVGYNQPVYGASPPVIQQQYPANPMSIQNQHIPVQNNQDNQANGVSAIEVQMGWSNGMCDCCENSNYCCYVCCCMSCALADLHIASNRNNGGLWWAIVLTLTFFELLWLIFSSSFGGVFNIINSIFLTYWIIQAAKKLETKLKIHSRDDCVCCKAYWCACCFICQMGRELERAQGQRKELIKECLRNIEEKSPCQCCGNKITHASVHL